MEKIKSKTKMADAISIMKESKGHIDRLQPCVEAVDWMEQYKGLSFIEVIYRFLQDPKADESWAAWGLRRFGKQMSPEVKEGFIAKVHDPMMAFELYTRLEWLTDEEDKLLEAKFKGKVPTAEAELANGIVKRRKKNALTNH